MRIAVLGAGGRMGRALVNAIVADSNLNLCGALEQTDSPYLGKDAGEVSGIGAIGVVIESDLGSVFKRTDAVIDFTTPAVSVQTAELVSRAPIVHVIGTTGFTIEDEGRISAAAAKTVIVKSGNMSLGVTLLAALTEQAARALGAGFDMEIVEMHHRHKADAPSGTALLLGEAAARGLARDLTGLRLPPRDGHTGPRPAEGIGFAVLRGGSVTGDHTVIFAGEGERIELTHRAESRSIFANGALRAAMWAKGREPGLYSMRDVLGIGGGKPDRVLHE